jgi:ATP/maltotriose-dependent transcriptional regulator MalT
MRVSTDPEGWAHEGEREARRALSLFENKGDERGLAKAWSLLGLVHTYTCRFGPAEIAWEEAAAHANVAGSRREELEYLSWVPFAVWGGPTPVPEAIRRCENIVERAAGDRKTTSTALFTQAKLEAMRGDFDQARELITSARSILQEVELSVWVAGPLTQMAGWIELLAGDFQAAERHLRWGTQRLNEIGELSWLSTVTAILAEAVYAQDRLDEAEELLGTTKENAGSEDSYSQVLLHSIRAKVLSRRGQSVAAEREARAALAMGSATDFLFLQAFTLTGLAEILRRAEMLQDANECLVQALRLCEQKAYLVGVAGVRKLLEEASA